MKNWKTTVLGVVTIVAAVAGAIKSFLTTGSADWSVIATAIASGWGLIHASDATDKSVK